MNKNRIKLTESQLHSLIAESVITALNELDQRTKASGMVNAQHDMNNLQAMKRNGQTTFNKNGRTVDIDNEISRRNRQINTFGNGLAHDLSMEYDPRRDEYQSNLARRKSSIQRLQNELDKVRNGGKSLYGNEESIIQDLNKAKGYYRSAMSDTHGYSVHSSHDGNYSIDTPQGRVYSNPSNGGISYDRGNNNSSNVNRLTKLHGITDAMSGYDDELNGYMDKDVENLKRRQNNVRNLRDYDDAYARWQDNDRQIKSAQSEYDRMSPLNPKKWFSKRPMDGPQAPTRPTWEGNENGEFDGYFSHHNPEDYDKDITNVRDRQARYRQAKKDYFG